MDTIPVVRWPWQRSLQIREVLAYTVLFTVSLVFLTWRMGQIIYHSQVEQAEHELEVEAFLTANTLEDPLNGFVQEFDTYSRFLQNHIGQRSLQGVWQEPMILDMIVSSPERPEMPRLQQVARQYAGDTEARVTILDAWGNVIVDSLYPVEKISNQLNQIEVQAALNSSEQHHVRGDPFTKQATVYVAAPIQQGGRILGVVRLGQSMETVTATSRRLLVGLIVTSVITVLITIGVAIWISRQLVKPIQQLEHAAIAISRGDLEQRVPLGRSDELGTLAQAFNRMAARLSQMFRQQDQFIANASHELRTPLANIRIRSEALLRTQDDPEATQLYLAEISSETERLGRLAADLLDLARLKNRIDTPEHQMSVPSIDPYPYLLKTYEMMRLRAQVADLFLICEVPDELPWIQIRPEQFETLIVNLLDNAIKYTPEGGEVKLSAHIIKKTETDNGHRYLQIRVQDTGIGIPPQDLPHIFERFYQVDKARSRRLSIQSSIGSGAGLGLSIIQEIVYTHGGHVWVESSPEEGSFFSVEFQAIHYRL